MYVASKISRTKKFHSIDCPHARRIKVENRIYFRTIQEATECGYHFCIDCCHIGKYYRKERNRIVRFCQQNGVMVKFNNNHDCLDVSTPYSKWRIIVNGKKKYIFLYHRNTFYKQNDEASIVPGYHSQKVRRSNIVDYLQYIVKHDAYRLNNPLEKPKTKKKKWYERKYPKGSKNYKKQQKRKKRIERSRSIKRVEELLKALEA